ncbi:hypothetical protein pBo12 [Bovine gammaherpesvirus 4]|uniref:Overlaps with other ORF n=2 Tax=Bovine herpesvirus 4 TaxID=10385 RepID=Q65542_BHV4|nr:hypothetical protein pBo12 [Bovine gammaherpesvirus 4]AAC15904.1 overlaps with other ORF; no protein identified; Method: conceptual translation supplied by author [Bovine gammaherpesvirus 4]AAK07990.1 hypothetical protein pBo12 [Bovine gammaherpesvirus 4]QJC19122.1 putative protein pBo12 [Bovine gammaherpesvirus 4]WIV69329.1 hypothetical protein pBo12 [Bovine gammaherpesvirus 4]
MTMGLSTLPPQHQNVHNRLTHHLRIQDLICQLEPRVATTLGTPISQTIDLIPRWDHD